MSGTAENSSQYYWVDCDPQYNDKDSGAGISGGPSAGLLILFTTYCFEFLVGCPLNIWLICHILRRRSKVTGVLPVDFFPFHLALTQVSFYLILPPLFANHYLWQSPYVLATVTFLNSMVLVMKPLLLCLVCVERYMAVVRPIDYLRFKAHQYRWGCLAASWCIYILMASVAVVQRSAFIVCLLFLPVLVIDTFCSLSILKTLQKPPPGDRQMIEEKKKDGRKDDKVKKVAQKVKGEINSMKKTAFTTIVIIQAVLTVNYLPFIITLPMNGQVPPQTLKCQYMAMALAAAASCSYLQPLLYLHRLGRLPWMTSKNT